MRFINLTPHEITVWDEEGKPHVFHSQGIARVSEVRTPLETIDGIEVSTVQYGEVVGLPSVRQRDPKQMYDYSYEEKAYIVSAMVRAAVPHRKDVFSLGPLLRNEEGQVIGAVGLTSN